MSSNQTRLAGRQGGRLIIRTSCFGSAKQKPSEHPSDDLQDYIFVSANHILRPDHLSDGLSSRPITSFGRIIFRTDFRLDQSETLKIITSLEWSQTARVTRSRSPDLVRHIIRTILDCTKETVGNGGRSRHAQKSYVYVRIKSLYAQRRTSYAQSCLERTSRIRM